LDAISQGVVIASANGLIVHANDALLALTG